MLSKNKKRRKTRNNVPVSNSKPVSKTTIKDSYSNAAARMGAFTPNLMESTEYVRREITGDYLNLNTLYRQNWIVQRLINTIPQDMIKNWYKIKSQMDPDSVKALERSERMNGIRDKILEGLQWGRLYGGAAAIMIIEGHEEYLEEPLEYDLIMPDSFKGLIILDRWSGINPDSELVTDASDSDFGLPAYYTISDENLGRGVKVHHSRVLRFLGSKLPPIDEMQEQYWGSSVIESALEEIKKYDNTSYNIAMLVFKACLRIYAIEDFDELGAMDEVALKDLHNMLTAMNWMMSNQGLQIINAKDRFETQQFSFSGLSEVMETFMLDIAGAAEIPVTKLFGRSPAGMNATGESDLQNYYEMIDGKQGTQLRPIFDKLIPIMCMSLFGAIPDDLDYDFVSSRRPTEEERKTIATQITTAVIGAYSSAIISQKIALKELQQSADVTGMWNNITDEDIENADQNFDLGGESLPMPSMEEMVNGLEISQPS